MNSAAWEQLAEELRARDQWGDFSAPRSWPGTLSSPELAWDPVTMMVNGNISVERYQDILIRALDTLSQPGELEMVARALTRKEMSAATQRLLRFFSDYAYEQHPHFLWAVGNALHTIAPRDHLYELIRICRDRRFSIGRGQLVLHLSRFKKSEEVFQTLLSLLDDDSVRGHVIEALWRYGDARALPAIEATPVREGFYEQKAKATAVRRLRRKEPL